MKEKLSKAGVHYKIISLAVLLGFLLAGCLAAGGGENTDRGRLLKEDRNTGKGARLSVFLQLKKPSSPALRMNLIAVDVLAEGLWVPMISEPVDLDAELLGAGQLFVSRRLLPAGNYQKVRLKVEKPVVKRQGEVLTLKLQEPVVEATIANGLEIGKTDSASIFITWDVEASLANPDAVLPVMSVAPQSPPLVADLVYVACPDIDTVYLIRSDKNWVYGSLGIEGTPSYLGVNISAKRLYVLSAGDAMIRVVDIPNNRLIDSIRIPMVMAPGFMTMSPDGLYAYVLDERDNYVLRLDLSSGSLDKRVRLDYRPQYILYLSTYDRLAVSSAQSQTVYILDAETLETVDTVRAGNNPQGLAVWNNLLYIAESKSNTVTVYDLFDRKAQNRVRVGRSPQRILQSGDRVYVANYNDGSLSTMVSGQLGVSRKIDVGGRPLEMAVSSNRNWIYIGNEGTGKLTVLDSTTDRVYSEVDLGAAPLGIAVVQ